MRGIQPPAAYRRQDAGEVGFTYGERVEFNGKPRGKRCAFPIRLHLVHASSRDIAAALRIK